MRIAISGTHRTGKSTLVAGLAMVLPHYAVIDEPYGVMVEMGYPFRHPPSLDDFEAQLEHAVHNLHEGGPDVLFDRCPVDFLAYIAVHDDARPSDVDRWTPNVRKAVQSLDLIVFVPIEDRDRIAFARSANDGPSRERVDEWLKEFYAMPSADLGVDVLIVEGEPDDRVRAVLQRLHV